MKSSYLFKPSKFGSHLAPAGSRSTQQQYLSGGLRNKNELLTLTGAIYAFVAYLTAFTLEILFIIDLAKRESSQAGEQLAGGQPEQPPYLAPANTSSALDQARLTLDSVQTHMSLACLAITVLYFATFVASLFLVVSLILRSSFFVLTWMCIMTALYLPEFGLAFYAALYAWGLATRNGQTELLFYLIRATLNVIFILRAHRLFKEWSYERNFFMLKSSPNHKRRFGSQTNGGAFLASYDSPYFIGDSLTTTINPIFSASSLNLDRYDQIRTFNESPAQLDQSTLNTLRTPASPDFGHSGANPRRPISAYLRHQATDQARPPGQPPTNSRLSGSMLRQSSILSFNDDLRDLEMDLDYRTLTKLQRQTTSENLGDQYLDSMSRSQPHHYNKRQPVAKLNSIESRDGSQDTLGLSGFSPPGPTYSTQSLDRRHLKDMDYAMTEQVILKPLGHQPFDYLQRPGSSSNLSSINIPNTQPFSYFSSGTKSAKGNNFSQSHHFI